MKQFLISVCLWLICHVACGQETITPASPSSPEAQREEIARHIEIFIDAKILPWRREATPITARVLELQKTAYLQVLREVLDESLPQIISPKRQSELQWSLERDTAPLFEFNIEVSPASERDRAVEIRARVTEELWPGEGNAVLPEQWRWNLLVALDLFNRPPLSDQDKVLLRHQVESASERSASETARHFPGIARATIDRIAQAELEQTLHAIGKSSAGWQPVAPDQWPSLLGLGIKEQQEFMEEEARSYPGRVKRDWTPKWDEVKAQEIYGMFFSSTTGALRVGVTSQLQARYPKDLSRRHMDYIRKMHERLSTEDQKSFEFQVGVPREELMNLEIMTWLLRVGLEALPGVASVKNARWKATLTLPLPLPSVDDDAKGQPDGQSQIELFYALAPPSKMKLAVGARSEKVFIKLKKGEGLFDYFMYRIGMSAVLDGHHLTTWGTSYSGVLNLDLNRTYNRADVWMLRDRDTDPKSPEHAGVPLVDPYLRDAMTLLHADWSKAKQQNDQVVGNIQCRLLELRYARPLKLAEPHFITASRRFFDVKRDVLLRQEDLDAAGKVVATTEFQDWRQGVHGTWRAMRSITQIMPGQAQFYLARSEAERKTPLPGKVEFAGRTIYRVYRLLDDIPVLSKIVANDDKGRALLTLALNDFQINRALPVETFRGPPRPPVRRPASISSQVVVDSY